MHFFKTFLSCELGKQISINSLFDFKLITLKNPVKMNYGTFPQLSLIMLLSLTKTIQTSNRVVAKSTFLMF